MKIDDRTQNLPARIRIIHIFVFVLLAVLAVRLYYLQINKGDYYQEKAENQRVRLIPITAPRGAIFDRNGKILVDSRPIYNITLANESVKKIDLNERVDIYAQGLSIDRQFVVERLNFIKTQPEFETLVLKKNATIQDISWIESRLCLKSV